ncbi:pre-mRNA-processing factor 6-like [Schistocerca gregaria]|uniref:pre-mRNA-processing factor 6-like n=1 Tax=Schistocerca gregaria TaxID=7010 RepID=UPI00211E9D4E|nr:pre-mRNA-processing factor 6-like [Schistocerca gregaria]
MSILQPKKPHFLTEKPPAGYIPGVGRGATGFMTRSDIGDAREPTGITGRGGSRFYEGNDFEDEESGPGDAMLDENDQIFASGSYDAEDEEADAFWNAIDRHMDTRRLRQRERREKEEQAKFLAKKPKIQTIFADAKKALASVSQEEWEGITEIGDRSLKYKQQRPEKFTPAPDSLLEQARRENQRSTDIVAWDSMAGSQTPGYATNSSTTPLSNLEALGNARKTVLGSKLENAHKSVISGLSSTIEREGYLSALSIQTQNAAVGDIEKGRLLLKSATANNPTHAPSWIALARLEESAGRLSKARKVIEQGCTNCPLNKEVWLEAGRINTPEAAKSIMACAVQHLPNEPDLWLAAANLETELERRKRVFKKALERIPTSTLLWKEAVDLEDTENAKIMLSHAVTCVPQSAQMWLALARLEVYENAKVILNSARKAIPKEKSVWIAAAQLEEANGNEKSVQMVIHKGIISLEKNGVVISRQEWLKEAERCEDAKSLVTCQAIIYETIGLGIEEQDWKSVWREDVEKLLQSDHIHCARSVLTHAATTFKTKKSFWADLALLEKKHGPKGAMVEILMKAVTYIPRAESLWLMAAKEEFSSGRVDEAREIIKRANEQIPRSEEVWLAAAMLEQEDEEYERARHILRIAREQASSARIWMKSAMLERQLHQYDMERKLLDEALKRYPDNPKLRMMSGQWYERKQSNSDPSDNGSAPSDSNDKGESRDGSGGVDRAREEYQKGMHHCPSSIPLFLCAIRYEEKSDFNRARALCDRARLKFPNSPEIWVEAIRIERRSGHLNAAQLMCSKALQRITTSGIIWAEQIDMETKSSKRTRFADAIKHCDSDAVLIATGAKIFWEFRKLQSAREWFERAVKVNSDYGDVWAMYYKFESQHGTAEQKEGVLKRCVDASPRYGEKWLSVAKNPDNFHLKVVDILERVALLV